MYKSLSQTTETKGKYVPLGEGGVRTTPPIKEPSPEKKDMSLDISGVDFTPKSDIQTSTPTTTKYGTFDMAKDIVGGAKSVVSHPIKTLAGVGVGVENVALDALSGGLGLVGAKDASKYVSENRQAWNELFSSTLKGKDEQTAGAVGEFVGTQIPYILGGEALGAIGEAGAVAGLAKYGGELTPSTISSVGRLVKTTSNVLGFTAVNQLTLPAGTKGAERLKQLRNDILILGALEGIGAGVRAYKEAKWAKNARAFLSELESGKKLNPEELRTRVDAIKAEAVKETGKTPKETLKETHQASLELKYAGEPTTQFTTTAERPVAPLTDKIKPSGIAKSIETKAVEDKLTKGFKDIAGYEPITIKEQAKRATDLINSDINEARSIIRGEKPLPEGLRGTSLITAMEEKIKQTKDPEMAYELANSPLVSETSFAAQEMRLMAERIPDSATAKLKEIKMDREIRAGKDLEIKKTTAKKSLKTETRKINLPKEELSWDRFLDTITC